MRKRPYKDLYFNHIEDKFLNSTPRKELISDLLYELTFRRATKDVQNLQIKLHQALRETDSKNSTLNEGAEAVRQGKHASQSKNEVTMAPSIKVTNNVFGLTDVPVSLRGFAQSISQMHKFEIDVLASMDPNLLPAFERRRLERLKTSIIKKMGNISDDANGTDIDQFQKSLISTSSSDELLPEKVESRKTISLNVAKSIQLVESSSEREAKIVATTVSPYLKQLHQQKICESTSIAAIHLPRELEHVRDILLSRNPTLTVGELPSIRTQSVRSHEINALKTFCKNRLKINVFSKEQNIEHYQEVEMAPDKSKKIKVEKMANFKLSDVPVEYLKLVKKTAHIHRYQKEKLALSYYSDISELELKLLIRLRKILLGNQSAPRKSKVKTSKIYSVEELNSQAFSDETLLSVVKLPPRLAKAQSDILTLYGSMSVGKLLKEKSTFFGINKAELLGIRMFCKQRLVEPSNSEPKVVFKDKSDSSKLIASVFNAEEVDRGDCFEQEIEDDFIVEDRDISIQGKFSLSQAPRSFHNLILKTAHIHRFYKEKLILERLICCNESEIKQIVLLKNYFLSKGKTKEDVKKVIVPSKLTAKPKLQFGRSTLLESIPLPSELAEIKSLVDLNLSIHPTVGDFFAANNEMFTHVDRKAVEVLKEFYQAGLIEESNGDKLTGKEAFYKLPNEKFAIVDAPPGCGKTHSIINKLDSHLAQIEQFYDARKVLVLSFTRNAVNELKQRIADFRSSSAQKNIDLVRVMTFDAFAYRVLSDSTDIGPSDDFDANITKVKALLIDGYKGGSSLIDELRWIYIDEYQDLVGCRADLVIELTKLVKRRKGAVNLLGDPCQQIMNFQLKKGSSKTTNEKFKFEFEKLAASKLAKVELTESYRFKTTEQRVRVEQLRSQMLSLGSSIDGRDFAGFVGLANVQEGSALLCSRNIDCLLAKRLLTKAGKKAHINQGSDRITVPSWLFDVFKGWKQTSMSRSTFIKRCQHNVCSSGEKEWKYLEKLGVCDADKVKVELLVRIVEERGGVTSDLDSRTVMISTVHKAKGLQYPQVIYQTDEHIFEKKSESLNEFYVAVTRAQEKFSFLEKSRWPKLKKNRAKAPYKHEGSYFLEGIREIELKSFFPDASSLRSCDMEFLMSSEAKFKVAYLEGKAFVVSTLPNGKQVKIYRLPRLEYCRELEGLSYVPKEVVPDHFATFVYVGESPRLENILGPTCFIKVPVFEGFWNAKDL
ncbi:TPA: AAA family ATPase [Vibrio vulnificus]|nr:AAA family ATPase [Vibrio vulnificus]